MTRQAADLKKGCPSSPNSGHTATCYAPPPKLAHFVRQLRMSPERYMKSL